MEIQVSALLLTQAPACHLQASVEKPGSFPSLLLLLFPVCWHLGPPAFLSWESLLPAHTLAQKALTSAVPPFRPERNCLQEGGEWLLPVLMAPIQL